MTQFKIGDVVRLKTDGPDKLSLTLRCFDLTDGTVLCMSECSRRITWVKTWELELVNRPDPQADIKQAIREVLLSDEFLTKFAAAFIKTPLPIAMPCDDKDGERIQSLADYPFGEPANATAIPGTPVGWELVGFKQIQDDVKVFDEDGDYWTFGGTNDAGDLTGALMPIFQKTEAPNDPT